MLFVGLLRVLRFNVSLAYCTLLNYLFKSTAVFFSQTLWSNAIFLLINRHPESHLVIEFKKYSFLTKLVSEDKIFKMLAVFMDILVQPMYSESELFITNDFNRSGQRFEMKMLDRTEVFRNNVSRI